MANRQFDVFEIQMPTNPMGTAAFVLSLVALLTLGILSPITLVMSIAGVQRQPRDLAIAGLVFSTIGCLMLIVLMCFSSSIWDYFANTGSNNRSLGGSRPKWTAAMNPGRNLDPYQEPIGHPWAVASKARLGESPLGSPTLFFELKNVSSEPIARIKVDVAVTEKDKGPIMAQANLSGSFNKPVQPGASRPVELRIPIVSDLNAIFPEPNEVNVTIIHVER